MKNEKYLAQQLVRRISNKVPDMPEKDVIWNKTYLGELTQEQFSDGICAFNDIIKNILSSIQASPQDWDVSCVEAIDFPCKAPRTPDEAKVEKQLWDIGNLLLMLGAEGTLANQMLNIENMKLFNKKKTKTLLNKLQDFGFYIQYSDIEPVYSITYPDNYIVLHILKAYSFLPDSCKKNILFAEWRCFQEDSGGTFEYDINDFVRGLNENDSELTKSICNLLEIYGYAISVLDTGGLQFEPKHKKDKNRLMYVKRERDDLSYIFRFDNAEKYTDICNTLTESVKKKIIKGYNHDIKKCCGSKKCIGFLTFTLDNQIYYKCRAGGGVNLINICKEDGESILKLLECEIKTRLSIAR